MRLVLLGPPGAGKGTQGQALALSLGVPHIASGDLVRDHIARATDFGRKVEAAIAAGNFAPDADILFWVQDRLAQSDARQGYILDGFPRDLAQAQAFTAPLDAVVELVIAEEALIQRLGGRLVCPTCDEIYHMVSRPPLRPGVCDRDGSGLVRRPDDEPEAIKRRLRLYHEVTEPLRAFYDSHGLLLSVDAVGEASDVTRRILAALPPRLQNVSCEGILHG